MWVRPRGGEATRLCDDALDLLERSIEQGALIGLAFHPEVTGETRFHQRFLGTARRFASKTDAPQGPRDRAAINTADATRGRT